MKNNSRFVSSLIAPFVVFTLLFTSYAHSIEREECPTNLAPGVYSIQLMVTKSLGTARGMGKKAGINSWIYESITGNFVVASGVYEKLPYAQEALQHL